MLRHLALLAALLFAAPLAAQEGIRVEEAWSRPAITGGTAIGLLTIRNAGPGADRLLGARSPAAREVQIHSSSQAGGVADMRALAGIDIPAGGTVTLDLANLHLMVIGLGQGLRPGQTLPVTLRFERAGEVPVTLAVRTIRAKRFQDP